MGQAIERTTFSADDGVRFRRRLEECLEALEVLLAKPDFGRGEASLGAELELCIVDDKGRALPIARELLESTGDPRLTLEINRYDIEANLTPGPLAGASFRRLEGEMTEMIGLLDAQAAELGARVVPIGILPTLRPRDLVREMITPDERYEALQRELRERRGEKFRIELAGRESLRVRTDSVAPEGASTSLQIHYRAHNDRFVELFNAVQLLTPLLVGVAANSPWLLGRELWHETRIGLFRQSIDGRNRKRRALRLPARVHLGHGWLRRTAFEAFAETVRLYEPLLPICSDESPLAVLAEGRMPVLGEMDLQMGTVWPWNRVIYDPADKGHVRVELRAIPAGPGPIDMTAHAALAIGLAEGILDRTEAYVTALPHELLVRNLAAAAREGMAARILWPQARSLALEERALTDVLRELLPSAETGLAAAGVDQADAARYLGVIDHRLDTGQNGASWQIAAVRNQSVNVSRKRALRMMFARYAELASSNEPVGDWPVD